MFSPWWQQLAGLQKLGHECTLHSLRQSVADTCWASSSAVPTLLLGVLSPWNVPDTVRYRLHLCGDHQIPPQPPAGV